jgi:hypothetical protein
VRGLRKATGLFIACALASILAGCSIGSQIEHERQANLDHAVAQFDPRSIASLTCDVRGGSIANQRGFTRLVVFEGAGAWDAVAERFRSLGYSGTSRPPYLSMARKDGILASGRLISDPQDQPDLVPTLQKRGCAIPADGAVMVQFEERAVPAGGN